MRRSKSGLSRRQFLRSTSVGAGGLLIGGRPKLASSQQAHRPKNVLILMADQHRPTALGIAGDPVARTPHLDEFARAAVRFDSAYCTDPICVCSRASLLTGLYVHNHRVYNNDTAWPFGKRSIAHYFGRAGYMTALIGKMHFVDAQTHGFDYYLEFNDWFQYLGPKVKLYAEETGAAASGFGLPQILDLWKDYGDPWIGVREKDGRQGLDHPGRASKIPEQDHFESFVTRESIRFLRDHGKKQPFFLLASYLKPHSPFMPAERFYNAFRADDLKLPDTWGKVDRAKVPAYIRRTLGHPTASPELTDPKWAKVRMACYYASLAQMDDCLGHVLTALRDLGLEDETIVLYTSDHGDMLGAHGLWGKFVFYEPSLGVPLMYRVPGLTGENVRCQTPVSQVQILPTLLDLCGLPIPAGLDGQTVAPSLRDPAKSLEAAIFAENRLGSPSAGYMIRRGDYKYCYCPHDMPELYNLRSDPQEMDNLALKPEYQTKVKELQAELLAWHQPSKAEAPAAAKPG